MLQKNQIIPLEITDITHEGSGIGHYEGMAVFVPNSAIGDSLEIRILKVNKTHCFGLIEKIIVPSPDRIQPACPVSRQCGGCVFQHISYEAELRYKQRFVEQNFRRIGGIFLEGEPIEASPQPEHYRNKAQYPIRKQDGMFCTGFFAPRSHRVINCEDCQLQPPVFSKLIKIIRRFCEDNHISAYDEKTQKGLLRHIYLRRGAHSQEMMVCLVCNGHTFPKSDQFIQTLREIDPNLASVLLNVNQENTNVILGKQTKVLFGKPAITDTMCGLHFTLSPHAFYQVNTVAAERLYAIAAEYAGLTGEETLLDLYCGVGTIGLSMAAQAKNIIGVEIIPQAVQNASANAAANKIENARFLCGDAGEAAAQLAKEGIHPHVVILDPPRKGCDSITLETVAKMCPERIVYISCNSATLARDCAMLQTLDYKPVRYRPVDLFPRTHHVETVCLLSKLRTEHHIEVDLDLGDMDLTSAESKATYDEIKAYVLEKFGLKVSSLYISQIKRKCGLEVGENYNHPKSENTKVPTCPPEKETAIRKALEHFKMV